MNLYYHNLLFIINIFLRNFKLTWEKYLAVSNMKDRKINFDNEQLTERLFKYMGGIHCTAAEIPA